MSNSSHINCQLSAVCGEKAPAHSTGATGYGTSTVARKTTKAAVHHNTPNEWSVKPCGSSQ